MTEDEKYLHDHLLVSIQSGLQSLEDVIEETLEIIEDEALKSVVSEEWATETIKKEYEKYLKDSETWTKPTDVDRLHEVFDKLNKRKIVALHNAGYTTDEAIYDIQSVWKELEDSGISPIGYCYYHGQDLARAVETDTLMIGFYGRKANNDKDAIAIGNIVVELLKDAKFEVQWDGTTNKRITLKNFKWHNLFVSHDDVEEKWGYERVIELMQ